MTKNIDIDNDLQTLENLGQLESREPVHSRVLAYFLRNNFDFLKKILNDVGINNYENINIDIPNINHEIDGRKDIEIKNDKFVLVIENKYKDRNRSEQLENYEKDINNKYPDLEKKFIYLRPFMHKLDDSCKNWTQYTYKKIKNFLQETISEEEPQKAYTHRYINIIENQIYGMQKYCIECLADILEYKNKINSPEDNREDIDGWSVSIPVNELLNGEYSSFLEIEHSSPFEKSKGELKINLTMEKSNKTENDDILLKKIQFAHGYKILSDDKNYIWCSEEICKNKDFSKEIAGEKLKNSKIIGVLKNILLNYATN